MAGADSELAVVCVGAGTGGTVPARLGEVLEGVAVEVVSDPGAAASVAGSAGCDCLVVVVGDGGVDVAAIEALPTDSVPVVAFVDPGSGRARAALDAGATDVVTASGSDRFAVLAHRVRTAVERESTLADLQETRARFEALTSNTSFAIVTIDASSTVQYASPAVEELFGYAPEELVGESLTAIMPERFHEPHHAAVADYLDTGERSLDWDWIELPGQHRDGTEFPLGVSFGERSTEEGHLFSAVIRDMSDQREREARLDRLDSAVESSMDGIAILDADGVYQYVNEAHAAVYGYDDPEEMVGMEWRSLYDDIEVARFESEVMPTVAEAGQWRGEATGRRADGSTFPQELSLTELDDGGLICVVRDVTDRVERRRELTEERQFVESVIDTLPDAFYVISPDGTFSRWNDEMLSVTGYTAAELEGMHALEVVPREDRERVSEAIAAVFTDREPQRIESAVLTKQDERIPHEFSGSPVVDADGEVVGLAGIGRDVSTQRLREKRLSVLSRVLRHNVRNRTTVIQGSVRHVAERVDDPELRSTLETAETAAADLASTSERARRAENLLRDEDAVQGPVDLVGVVERAIETTALDGVDLRTDLPDAALAVGNEAVHHAVGELLANARDHVADPTVRVSVREEGDWVAIVVADDGPGIPAHEREAVQSSRDTDLAHGTGLGLWLVEWITSTSGGTLSFRESDLGGTAVVLSFPAA